MNGNCTGDVDGRFPGAWGQIYAERLGDAWLAPRSAPPRRAISRHPRLFRGDTRPVCGVSNEPRYLTASNGSRLPHATETFAGCCATACAVRPQNRGCGLLADGLIPSCCCGSAKNDENLVQKRCARPSWSLASQIVDMLRACCLLGTLWC
jgi:hypothetical protein